MWKISVIVVLVLASSGATAHEDRVLPIAPDGTLGALPSSFGVIKARISRAPGNSRSIAKVELTSPRFSITLSPCVLAKLRSVSHVEASGSWYHDLSKYPPYVSLTFFTGSYDPKIFTNDSYSVTISLVDGRILSGMKIWDPWWGQWRGIPITPADKCSGWRAAGLWPNNSFKPKPLRGSA